MFAIKTKEKLNKKINKWLVAGLIIAGSFFAADAVYAATPGELTGDHVRVRTSPCLESDNILFQVSRGQIVEILDIAGDFYRVNVRYKKEVYIFREFVRELPDVQELESESEIEIESETEQYIEELHQLLSATGQEEPVQQSGNLIDDILAYAKSYIGTPYRFGSTDPARGFDCSGFVTVVMRQFNINLQRSSASMATTNGTYVARNDLQPGDLVFFATGGGSRISHVGIYIGGNRFIHSASCVGVKISGMNEPYYRARYVRANRIL